MSVAENLNRIAVIVCFSLISSCISALGQQANTPVDTLESTVDLDTTSVAAIIEYDSSRIVIAADGRAEFSRKQRIRILREAGLGYGQVQLDEDAFAEIDAFHGRVLSVDGTEILKRSRKDMYKDCGFGGSYTLYRDICTFTAFLTAGNYPFTVEFDYKQTLQSLFAWPEWRPQYDVPVLSSCYTVDAPADFIYRTDAVNLGSIATPVLRNADRRTITSWSANNVVPFKPEPYSPPDFESRQRLDFAPLYTTMDKFPLDATDWSTLAAGYYQIARRQLQIGSELEVYAARFLGNGTDDMEQIKNLHHELISRLRYVAISIGIGGWQPHSAEATFHNRYGDCKDLSTLYVALLSRLGYRAHLALIRTKDIGLIKPDFPTLSNFNHVILMFQNGNDTLWADPTCSVCEIGDIPNSVEDVFTLIIDAENGQLIKTPLSPAVDNKVSRRFKLRIATDNSAKVIIDLDAAGNPSHRLKLAAREMTSDEFREYLRQSDFVPEGMTIERCDFDKFDSSLSHFSCQVTGSIRRAAQRLGDRIHFKCASLSSPAGVSPLDLEDRETPLLLGSTLTVEDEILVEIPEEWQLTEIPDAQSIESPFGSLSITGIPADSTADILLKRAHITNVSRIAPSEFESFAAFQSNVSRAFSTVLVFQKH